MKLNQRTALTLLAVFVASIALVSFVGPNQETKPWTIPAKYVDMKNPVKADAASLKEGKLFYDKYCKACHGMEGKGDGPKARNLKTTFIGDFSKGFGKQNKDGEIYYKAMLGRDEMPNFEKKILVEKQRWSVINYIKGMKK